MKLEKLEHMFCINLERRPNKWDLVSKEFKKHNLCVERVDAVDGSNLDSTKFKNRVKMMEMGCLMSHLKVLKLAQERKLPYVCVFEDDVMFTNEIQNICMYLSHVPDDWKIIYIGSNCTQRHNINKFICKLHKPVTTHAMIINSSEYEGLIQLLESESRGCKVVHPVDMLLAIRYENDSVYGFNTKLVTQRPSFSDIQNRNVNYNRVLK